MEFKASYDLTTKITTAVVVALMLGFFVSGFFGIFGAGLIGGLILGLTLAVCLLYAPIKYSVTPTALLIHRRIGPKAISRSGIAKVEMLHKKHIRFAVRTFGVGGLFGFYRHFYHSNFGAMTWYLTRTDHPVLIVTRSDKKYLVSPDATRLFKQAIEPSGDEALR